MLLKTEYQNVNQKIFDGDLAICDKIAVRSK
jgi:hypothetical protein